MDINNLWSGYDLNSKKQNTRCLAVNTILEGKYLVGPVLGQGGFGITYVGYDLNMEAKIAIKEYFPVELVSRDTTTMHGDRVLSLSGEKSVTYKAGLKKYVAEAQNVSQFSEIQGVVSVKDFFYANETAYIVMEFIDGISLKDYLKEKGGRLSEEETLKIMKPVLEALVQVHKSGIIHRDISPDNIMLTFKDGDAHNQIESVKLIDFGAARMTEKNDQKSLTIILKHGYAPEEQYRTHGEQGPWTDEYALCAVFYRMLSGETPVPAMDRMFKDELKTLEQCGAKVTTNTAAAIMKGLAVKKDDRIQNVQELIDVLYKGAKVKVSTGADKAIKNKIGLYAGIGIAVVVACVAGVMIFTGKGNGTLPETSVAVETETAIQEEMLINTDSQEEQMGEQIVFYHPQKSISTSHDHILFCMQDGTVTARGENEDGECDTEEWTNVVAVAAGHGSSFGVRTDGTVLYAGNERLENVEYWENMIDVQPWNFGAVGLTKDGTILAMHPQDYGEEFEIMQKNMTSWENIKAIAAIDWDVFGLTEDGRVLSALNENSVITEGWNDVDYLLTDIYLGNSGLLSGLCADGTVRSVQLEDTSNAFYQENMASQTKVTQLSNRICVHEDGTVSIIDAYEGSDYQEEKMRETVESWTNVEAAAMFSHRTGYYYALKEDGTILYSAPNMGNAELNEFKNLEWIRLIEEEGTESLIAYTKDGRILATGGYSGLSDLIMSMNVDESMEDQMMISMDLANALRENPEMREEIEMEMMMLEMEGIDIAPNLDAEYRETIWTSPHYYEQLCEAASKVVYFDEEVLLRKDGTAIFHNNTEKIYTNVVDVENSNLDAVLYEDGTVELTSDTPHYKEINEWTNVIQLATYNRRLRGLCADGTILNEYSDTLNEGIPNAKVKSIYASENLHLGITEEDKVVVIENRGMTEDKGMLVVDAWENVKSLALGKSHTVGLLKDGTVVATGRNNAGQCDVEAWTDVVSIVAGSACTLGLTSNGDLLIAGELY